MHKWIITITFTITLLGCESDSPTMSRPSIPVLFATPMDNEEAELAALWLSGQIVAPVSLYRTIDHDLSIIREQWLDSIPQVSIKFFPYWRPSQISFGFYPDSCVSIEAGEYHAWDSLNAFYRLDSMDFANPIWSSFCYVAFTFEGRLNPMVLVDQYAGLPGLGFVYTDGSVGDRSVLLMYREDQEVKYFFRHAWGDCPSGCIHSEIFYFFVKNDSALFVDSYRFDWQNDDRPAWWDMVVLAMDNYWQQNFWSADTTR